MKTVFTMLALAITLGAIAPAATFAADKGAGIQATTDNTTFEKRRKPRVPGGSGCDDPRDLIEHPECRR